MKLKFVCVKLMSLNPLDDDNYSTYNVEISGFEFSFKANSIEEVAIKTGFVLLS